ncbi:MAG: hypothetical protein N2Z79_04575 [Candidatus Omnitrophica bacterium]|nr:hypothetical protein [Candidatus Omnitrophota bacterium]
MKNIILSILLIFILGMEVFAESITFSVSCTIPAIPGVNAPPFAEKKEESFSQVTKKESQNNFIEEKETKEIQLADGKIYSVIIKTVYER